jgi:regulator of protease activity HflC (stomatin/prohibitin superfamily)
MAGEEIIVGIVLIFVIIVVIMMASSGIKIIQPFEQGIYMKLGRFVSVLGSGFHFVTPLINNVVKIDLRTQVLDVPKQEVITKDNSPTNVDAVIYIKIIDPKKAYFQVQNYRVATVYLAQTTLRSKIGDMVLDEILSQRERINVSLRDVLDHETDKWGVKVEAVEIREVDPSPAVKAAMEEQTSSERQRRAAILRAEGQKRAAILSAEGEKRSKILSAEGSKQSRILVAEGQRLATILEGQGEAQKLRILSLGAAPLDAKALTVLSLDTLKSVGNGQATKIIFPFEITKLIEGAAQYLGTGAKVPERTAMDYKDVQSMVGNADKVLGPIPTIEEIHASFDQTESTSADKDVEAYAELQQLKGRKSAKDLLKDEEELKGN